APRRPDGMSVIPCRRRELMRLAPVGGDLPDAAEKRKCKHLAVGRPGWLHGAPGRGVAVGCFSYGVMPDCRRNCGDGQQNRGASRVHVRLARISYLGTRDAGPAAASSLGAESENGTDGTGASYSAERMRRHSMHSRHSRRVANARHPIAHRKDIAADMTVV